MFTPSVSARNQPQTRTPCLLRNKEKALRTVKQGESHAYHETRRTPCVPRNKEKNMRTAKQGESPAYCERGRTPCILRNKENTLRNAKEGENLAYCERRRTTCVLRNKENNLRTAKKRKKPCIQRNLWSNVIRKASCFSKPKFVYFVFNINFSCTFSCVASFTQCGLENSLCLSVSADSSIII